jgi:hypothetical protein
MSAVLKPRALARGVVHFEGNEDIESCNNGFLEDWVVFAEVLGNPDFGHCPF